MKTLTGWTALALALACAPALAADHEHAAGGMDHHAMMEECAKHDAGLSAEDRAKKLDEMFASIDLNHDGMVDKDEFTRHHAAMLEAHGDHAGHAAAPAGDAHTH